MSSHSVSVTLDNIARRFGRRVVFEGVSAQANSGEALVISGPNGSGKSTLLRIVAGLLAPSQGSVKFEIDGRPLDSTARRARLGYSAPDLALYGELSGAENLLFFAGLRGVQPSRDDLAAMLDEIGLKGRGRDLVREYSSGMRHRLKLAFALIGRPPVLILDEPTANLDAQGSETVKAIVEDYKRQGIVLIGTNEASELEWGNAVVRLGN